MFFLFHNFPITFMRSEILLTVKLNLTFNCKGKGPEASGVGHHDGLGLNSTRVKLFQIVFSPQFYWCSLKKQCFSFFFLASWVKLPKTKLQILAKYLLSGILFKFNLKLRLTEQMFRLFGKFLRFLSQTLRKTKIKAKFHSSKIKNWYPKISPLESFSKLIYDFDFYLQNSGQQKYFWVNICEFIENQFL